MEKSPREADTHSARQPIPRLFLEPEDSQSRLLQLTTGLHFKIILASKPSLPNRIFL